MKSSFFELLNLFSMHVLHAMLSAISTLVNKCIQLACTSCNNAQIVNSEVDHSSFSHISHKNKMDEYPQQRKFCYTAEELHEEYGLSLKGKLAQDLDDDDLPTD